MKVQDSLRSIKNELQKRRNDENMLGEMMHLTALKVNEKRETVVVVRYIFLNDINYTVIEEEKMIQYSINI